MDRGHAQEMVSEMVRLAAIRSGYKDHDRYVAYQLGYLIGFLVQMMMNDSAIYVSVKQTIERLRRTSEQTK